MKETLNIWDHHKVMIRYALANSETKIEAAKKLGVSVKTLRTLRKRMNDEELPKKA